jgi:hypothetical protein
MENNLYDYIEKNGYIEAGVFCLEICLQTLIRNGSITDEQRIEFFKDTYVGEDFTSVAKKFKKLIQE